MYIQGHSQQHHDVKQRRAKVKVNDHSMNLWKERVLCKIRDYPEKNPILQVEMEVSRATGIFRMPDLSSLGLNF